MTLIVDKVENFLSLFRKCNHLQEANYVPIDLMSPAARDLMLNLPLNIGGVSGKSNINLPNSD